MLEQYNPWRPIRDPLDLKHLGKLNEELNECGSAVARCIIQGMDEAEPTTGKVNRDWLMEEIADVRANLEVVEEHFNLDLGKIMTRAFEKKLRLKTWHKMT